MKLKHNLDLQSWKEIEKTATDELVMGNKIVYTAELILISAKHKIKELGGLTLNQENEKARIKRQVQANNNTKV